jgi:hypothetical protein
MAYYTNHRVFPQSLVRLRNFLYRDFMPIDCRCPDHNKSEYENAAHQNPLVPAYLFSKQEQNRHEQKRIYEQRIHQIFLPTPCMVNGGGISSGVFFLGGSGGGGNGTLAGFGS